MLYTLYTYHYTHGIVLT